MTLITFNLADLLPQPERGIPTISPADRDGTIPLEEMNELASIIANQENSCTSCRQAGCHTVGCPMGNNIPEVNKLFDIAAKHEADGNQDEANKYYKMSFDESWKTNRFGLITGLICPSKGSLCESSCIYTEDPIAIRGREYVIHQKAWQNGWVPPLEQKERLGKSIAIVGSGPGALATAEYAHEAGYDVTIIERSPVVGGLTALGIPQHKMDYEADVKQHYDRLKDAGVNFVTGTTVGAKVEGSDKSNITFNELAQDLGKDGIVLATGKYKPITPLKTEQGVEHVKQAIDFLTLQSLQARKIVLGSEANPFIDQEIEHLEAKDLNMKDKRVVVIGGSDTAADSCNVSAMRQGAASVTHLYRGTETAMKMDGKEKTTALEAGVGFKYEVTIENITRNDDNSLKVELSNGETIEADEVISATGFKAEDHQKMLGVNLPITDSGLVAVQEPIFVKGSEEKGSPVAQAGIVGHFNGGAEDVPVFAVGDITGSPLAVHALAGGRDIMPVMHRVISTANDNDGLQLPRFGLG